MCGGNADQNIFTGIGKALEGLVSGTRDAVKSVTGATAAEEANDITREQIAEQKAAVLKDREDAKAQTAIEQLSISQQASAARSGVSTPNAGGRSSTLGIDEERDFLGL